MSSTHKTTLTHRTGHVARAAFALLVMLLGHYHQPAYGQPTPYSHGDPTPHEQYMLELVNAARANPSAEVARLGIGLDDSLPPGSITPAPKPPLAFHPQLIAAARGHSDWMLSARIFNHTGLNGSTPSQRAAAQGFPYDVRENIAYVTLASVPDVVASIRDSHDGLMRSADHRPAIMNPAATVVGIGLQTGLFATNYPLMPLRNTLMTTQKFSDAGETLDAGAFVLGVAYRDANGNTIYDVGEGTAGLRVDVSPGNFYAITSTSGGYAVPVVPVQTNQDTLQLPFPVQNSSWDDVAPYDTDYRTQQLAAAPTTSLQITWSGGGLALPLTESITIRRPIRIDYKLRGTDGWFYSRTMVTTENIKRDLELNHALAPPSLSDFRSAGGYEAYLAANIDVFQAGYRDEASAYAHWRDYGRNEGRTFDAGQLRSDLPGGLTDPQYAIDGGFAWQYPDSGGRKGNTMVFITQDAPKPAGWDGRALLLQKGDLFNLGPEYTANGYRALNPDVANAIDSRLFPSFASVTDHYVKYGFKEGRLTNGNWTQAQLNAWNDNGYLNQNPDVRSFFQGAASEGWKLLGKYGFAHYINFGRWEGRGTGQ